MSIVRRIINDPKRLAPALPVALSLYFVFSSFSPLGVSADGQTYLQIARNIHFGIGPGWQALWVPPLHSCLIALFGWVPGISDLCLSAALVGALMGVFLVVAVWLLAEEIFGRTVALGASTICALFPHFLWLSKAPEAECTYTAFLVFALWLLCVALRKQSLCTFFVSGVVFSLAYLARSEGFLVMGFVIVALLAVEGRHLLKGKMLLHSMMLLIAFLIVSSPYLMFLKLHYGAWVISPKSTYVLIWMKSRTYHDNNYGETSNKELWGLTENGKLKWQVPSGVGDLIGYLMSHPAKSAHVYMRNLRMELPGNIPNNSGMEKYPQVFPLFLALAAVVAVFRKWGDRSSWNKAVILSPFMILFVLPVFTEGWWKYLVPYSPLLIILGCAGIYFTVKSLLTHFPQSTGRNTSLAAMLILGVYFRLTAFPLHIFSSPGMGAAPAPQLSASANARLLYAADAEKAGRWIAGKFGPGRNYMVQWSKLIYHLNGLWTAAPVADYPELRAFALSQGAEYYLIELNGDVPIEVITAVPPGITFETLYRSPRSGYSVAVYRFIPVAGL